MKTRVVAAVAALAIAFGATTASAQPAGYEADGEQKSSSKVKHRDYRFEVVPPRSAFADLTWKRFRNIDDSGATILVMGLSGLDTYALAVVTIADAAGATDPVALGRAHNESFEYAVHPKNPACAVTPLDAPVRLDATMVGYYAACLDPESGKAFELTFSRQSLSLMRGFGRMPGDPPAEAEPVEVAPAEFRATMDRFVGSFRFR